MSDPTGKPDDFDFEDWRRLHASDPGAFEQRRSAALESVISGAPEHLQKRLRGVQFRLDLERSRAGSDLAACLKAHTLMWDSLTRLREALEQLSVSAKPAQAVSAGAAPSAPTAKVIAFPGSADRFRQESKPDT
jgi:hypothetical protein